MDFALVVPAPEVVAHVRKARRYKSRTELLAGRRIGLAPMASTVGVAPQRSWRPEHLGAATLVAAGVAAQPFAPVAPGPSRSPIKMIHLLPPPLLQGTVRDASRARPSAC
jgi:hypothetical protein